MNLNFKRSYPLLLLLIAVVAILSLVMGNMRVTAYATDPTAITVEQANSSLDFHNAVALFDDSIMHSIQVLMDEDDYNKMISTYQNAGLKEYFKADIIIDGVRINAVGIRLKGNASLRTALGGGMGRGDGQRPGNGQPPQAPGDGERPQRPENGGMPRPPGNGQLPQAPENDAVPQGQGEANRQQAAGEGENPAPRAAQGIGPGMGGQTASGETKIPFLIKFDEYEEGQTYQGYSKLSIRTYGISYDAAMLQEPVTNSAARLAGLPATQTAYTGFAINDADEALYVISEIVDDKAYLTEYFENDNGILYKAEMGSTLSYQGEDPSSYSRSFSQETRVNDADLAPLIAFMRFLDQADEAAFERDLPKWLDVEAFASYLALNALVVNTDSMLGMNNNYYLYYDDVTEQFTLLMWDANESLGKLGGSAAYDISLTSASAGPGGNRGGPGGRMGGGQNILQERFLANANFKALYEQKVKEIYAQVYASGALTAEVERFSALIHAVNDERGLVEIEAYDQAVQKTSNFIAQRMEYLATTEMLGK
ncbi:MAG: CotH kinase family protein [Chloroflexota bacterium]